MSKKKTLPAAVFDDRWHEAKWRAAVRRGLLAWFKKHQRDLPWRKSQDPYKVWVSEIMLQQTQVATVIDYFNRFIDRFPTVSDLASAQEQEVLRLWEGLGYYRRARQLHAAAGKVLAEHEGRFPESYKEVLALPGIGRYTAGAILSISRDQRLPIVEANTLRLFSRLMSMEDPPTSKPGQETLWEFAEAMLPRSGSGTFNQAAMELGSLICTPREPACGQCPLASRCAAFEMNRQDSIPGKVKSIQYEDKSELAVVVQSKRQVLIRKCGPTERWAGLWDFPRYDITPSECALAAAADNVKRFQNQSIINCQRLATIKHGVTKYRITLQVVSAILPSARRKLTDDAAQWIDVDQLSEYPLSTTGRKIAKLLVSKETTI